MRCAVLHGPFAILACAFLSVFGIARCVARIFGRVARAVYHERLVIDLLLRVADIRNPEALGVERLRRRLRRAGDIGAVHHGDREALGIDVDRRFLGRATRFRFRLERCHEVGEIAGLAHVHLDGVVHDIGGGREIPGHDDACNRFGSHLIQTAREILEVVQGHVRLEIRVDDLYATGKAALVADQTVQYELYEAHLVVHLVRLSHMQVVRPQIRQGTLAVQGVGSHGIVDVAGMGIVQYLVKRHFYSAKRINHGFDAAFFDFDEMVDVDLRIRLDRRDQ